MDFLQTVWDNISGYISVPYMLIFMLLAYAIKHYFTELLQKLFGLNFKIVFAVFILATIIAIPFLIFTDEGWMKIIVSYAVGTSLHELIFKWIEKKIEL